MKPRPQPRDAFELSQARFDQMLRPHPAGPCAAAAGDTRLSDRRGGEPVRGGDKGGDGTPEGSQRLLPLKRHLIAPLANAAEGNARDASSTVRALNRGGASVRRVLGPRTSFTPSPNGRSHQPEPVKGSGRDVWDWRPTLLSELVSWTAA